MRVLHTSDWHIGHSLHRKKRYDEYQAFLTWVVQQIVVQEIDALLIAGDVFDTIAPSNRALKLYYTFLVEVSKTPCRHVVIIGGNHDSASLLNAPKELLYLLDVHIIGSVTENREDEIIELYSENGTVEAVVCAVPYLRDRDIRKVEAGESVDDKQRKLVEGVKRHYAEVCDVAMKRMSQYSKAVPLIGMGHLFAAGGSTVDGDGVRDLYVGNLGHIGAEAFPDCIDYLALGHLHVPQKVGGVEHFRYCGSPLAMGFGEAYQDKQIIVVSFEGSRPTIEEQSVPVFQALERISGTLEEIELAIDRLKAAESAAWIEVEYTGAATVPDLNEQVVECVVESSLAVLLVKNRRVVESVLHRTAAQEVLDELSDIEVFKKLLEIKEVDQSEHEALLATYIEAVSTLHETDIRAE
ncbi:MAG: exonuclease SbcCD subunit D C-terminal domain-containing protein [Fibrobacterales bacterium]